MAYFYAQNILVWSVDILNSEDGKVAIVSGVAQGDAGTSLDAESVDLVLVYIEGNGHAEKQAIGETVVLDDAN